MTDSQDLPALGDIHRQTTIQFLRGTGCLAVIANRGEKSPGKGWDPKSHNKDRSDRALERAVASDDNIGVHLHGALVDVDIDSDSPALISALDRFLPHSSHVWGRPSRPRTHRIYQLKGDGFEQDAYPFLRRLKRIPEASVEIRGGSLTRGEYSLLPGSVHPDGERYEWSDLGRARNSPTIIDIAALMRGVRLSAAVAVLAPHWVEGARNDLAMALAGFLYRVCDITRSMDAGMFVMERDDALTFFRVMLECCDDDPADVYSRVKTFEQTWRKAEAGAAVTGATTIAGVTGDQSIVQKLYVLFTDSPDVALIEEFVRRFAVWQGPGRIIDIDRAATGHVRPHMSRPEFTNSYGQHFIEVGGKKKLLAGAFFHMSAAMHVDGLTFVPQGGRLVEQNGGTYVNQWGGFAIEPYPSPVAAEDVQPFLTYLWEVVANQSEDAYRWVVHWLAHILQCPGEKSGTALVLVGVQGAGKSFLGHSVMIPIVGEQHAATTNSVMSVTRDFNVMYDNCVFIQCDEAISNQQRATANRLKSLITDPYKLVEPKGVDAYQKPNLSRFMFTSNELRDAIHLSEGRHDRRYTVQEVSAHRASDMRWWRGMYEWHGDPDNLARVHRFLRDVEIDWDYIRRPLSTRSKSLMQQHSWGVFDSWLAAMVSRGHPLAEDSHLEWADALPDDYGSMERGIYRDGWPEWVAPTALARDYAQHARVRQVAGRAEPILNEGQLMRELRDRGLVPNDESRRVRVTRYDDRKQEKVIKRVYVYRAPSYEAVRAYLRDTFDFSPDDLDVKDAESSPPPDDTDF